MNKKARRDKLVRESLEREMKAIRECTFKPKLQNSKSQLSRSMKNNIGGTVYDRSQMWKRELEERREAEREKEKDEMLGECSFKPDLVKSDHSFALHHLQPSPLNVPGVKEHINRVQHSHIQASYRQSSKNSKQGSPLAAKMQGVIHKKNIKSFAQPTSTYSGIVNNQLEAINNKMSNMREA